MMPSKQDPVQIRASNLIMQAVLGLVMLLIEIVQHIVRTEAKAARILPTQEIGTDMSQWLPKFKDFLRCLLFLNEVPE